MVANGKIPFSGEIWHVLNLANFLTWWFSPSTKILCNHHDVEPHCLLATCHLNPREVSSSLGRAIFGAIPSHLCPLLQCVLVLHLASRWDHLGACRATVQSTPHAWISNVIFLPKKREESLTSHTTGQNCHEMDMDFPWKYRKLMKCPWKLASWVFHGP